VTLDENGQISTYQCIQRSIELDRRTIIQKTSSQNQSGNFYFLHFHDLTPNQKVSDFYQNPKQHLSLSAALQICLEKNEIIPHENSNSLFCTFPLIGSNSHELPILLNSNIFQTTEKRDQLKFSKIISKQNEFNYQLSMVEINRLIFQSAISLYEKIVNLVISMNIKKRYHLLRGLLNPPCNSQYYDFDKEWYFDNFLVPLRNIISK
jgi:hypothetical protein